MMPADTGEPIVEVGSVRLQHRVGKAHRDILIDVSLTVDRGDVVGLVGESGSGKSTLATLLLGYTWRAASITAGTVRVAGVDVFGLSPKALQDFRARHVALVPQNAGAALTPTMRIAEQLDEVLCRRHPHMPAAQRRDRAIELLTTARLSRPLEALAKYPHQFSGGQQQRIGIAMALCADPALLVLDEPTTGLDVVTQAAILDTLAELQRGGAMSMVLVSHDLGVIDRMCSTVAVMRTGRILESGPVMRVLRDPRHPYTRSLIASMPSVRSAGIPPSIDEEAVAAVERGETTELRLEPAEIRQHPTPAPPVLAVRGLTVDYAHRRTPNRGPVVDNVSLDVNAGEIVALVGESGSGKSTIANAIAGLVPRQAGSVVLAGHGDVEPTVTRRPKAVRQAIQLIFQNADTSLNPRRTVRQAIARPLRLFGVRDRSVESCLRDTHLEPAFANRLPSQMSGGQRQRVGIARAIAAEPQLVLADEIVSALDVSVQSSILRLMDQLSAKQRLGFLFITHDLGVVRAVADRVVVLYLGRKVEEGTVEDIFLSGVNHPYTRMLLESVIELGAGHTEARRPETGDIPVASATEESLRTAAGAGAGQPPARVVSDTHTIWCHLTLEDLSKPAAGKTTAPTG